MMLVWPVPLPRGLLFASVFQIYFMTAMMAFVAGLPGFILGRLSLWRIGAKSPLAFTLAGAMAGYIAAAVLCLPNQLWVLRKYNVDLFGAGLGAVAGLIYQQAECILARSHLSKIKPLKFKEKDI
jgi:hypothetical protein